ncbi:MAG: methionine--tRNA ligase [Vicinamibacteraceae bacterium]|nr:methionine--tRNA ligase [Vicinamibacteraceae bacterium]
MPRFFLTTAIDYVNSRPHLGTAYEKITADVIARFARMRGLDTLFVMGNDEHSQNVFRKAREMGLDPVAYCDRMEDEFRGVWRALDISFDDFVRTTEARHRVAVERIVQRMYEAGDVYEGAYEGWYCVSCEAFKQEKDLVEGLCPVHRTRPEWIREKNYFFRLSKYTQPLRDHFAAHPEFLQPDVRRNEILRLLEGGLEDISISRAGQAWGIALPFDPQSVVYVWVDALINYITAVGYGQDEERFRTWWPADLHVIGKDITRFHCVIWPAMLMSAGEALPRQVYGHGWVHFRGEKMSKSLGTAVEPLDAVGKFGPDPLRLFLVKEIPYGGDGDFSWERFEERYNADLANNLGNLVSRVAAMVDRYRGGRLQARGGGALAGLAASARAQALDAMTRFALHEAVAAAYAVIGATNEFIAQAEPWVLAKSPDKASHLDEVLYEAAEATRIASALLWPVMPDSVAEILRRLGHPFDPRAPRFDDTQWIASGERHVIKAEALWPRLDTTGATPVPVRTSVTDPSTPVPEFVPGPAPTPASAEQATPPAIPAADAAAAPATPAPAPAAAEPQAPTSVPADDRLGIDEFMRLDLRVARVLEAERVPKSKKLVKMRIDVGSEERTIVAGIAEAYEPEALVGRTIAIVANLKPAKLMGIESNGMVLAASPEGGKPELLSFVDPPAPGTRIR